MITVQARAALEAVERIRLLAYEGRNGATVPRVRQIEALAREAISHLQALAEGKPEQKP